MAVSDEELFTRDEVMDILKNCIHIAGGIDRFATKNNFSRSVISIEFHKRRKRMSISPAIINALGLEEVIYFRQKREI